MTRPSRIPTEAGFCDPSALPRGPNGRALCRRCGNEVPRARMTFCGPACVHEWKLRTQPAYQAQHVLERDRGVCAACGIDCVALLEELRRLRSEQRRGTWARDRAQDADSFPTMPFEIDGKPPFGVGPFDDRCRALGIPRHLRSLSRRLWEMDHAVPVIEGGGSCGLENLRTLCWACHRAATAELARRRASKRRTA